MANAWEDPTLNDAELDFSGAGNDFLLNGFFAPGSLLSATYNTEKTTGWN